MAVKMSDPFNQDARPFTMKEEMINFREACTTDENIPHPQSSFGAAEAEEDDIPYLLGMQFFDVVLAKTQVAPHFRMFMPANMVRLLPRATVPVVLRHAGKNWDLSYIGNSRNPRFDPRWKAFVTDNHLEFGDACVFELMDNSATIMKFRVHILKNDIPPELQEVIDSRGKTRESAIDID